MLYNKSLIFFTAKWLIYCRKKKSDREKEQSKTNQRAVGLGTVFLWRVHKRVQKICILLKYSYLCAEFKSKQIWKHYQ